MILVSELAVDSDNVNDNDVKKIIMKVIVIMVIVAILNV